MKITHIVASIDRGFGVSAAVSNWSEGQAVLGHDVTVMSLGQENRERRSSFIDMRYRRDFDRSRMLFKLGFSQSMRDALYAAKTDVLHSHGLWMMPNVYPSEAASRIGKPLVLSPHGMLGPESLNFSRWKKKIFWMFRQKAAIELVTCFHATSESEYANIRALGFRQPVAIIPCGMDIPTADELPPAQDKGYPFILSLGRIHPIKGLPTLISAFSRIADNFPSWRLRIVGPDECGHKEELKRQIAELGLGGKVTVEPPIFGDAKNRLMSDAQIFVVSSLYESFGMTIAESLALGTPVISTWGAPWSGLRDHNCGWWIDHGAEPMAIALYEAMSMSREGLQAMGARGRRWIERDFAPDTVALKMVALYAWLCDQSIQPDFVRTV